MLFFLWNSRCGVMWICRPGILNRKWQKPAVLVHVRGAEKCAGDRFKKTKKGLTLEQLQCCLDSITPVPWSQDNCTVEAACFWSLGFFVSERRILLFSLSAAQNPRFVFLAVMWAYIWHTGPLFHVTWSWDNCWYSLPKQCVHCNVSSICYSL